MQEARKARQKLGINLSSEEANELFMIPPGAEDEINILFIDFVIACFIMIMHKVCSSFLSNFSNLKLAHASIFWPKIASLSIPHHKRLRKNE